MSIAVDGKAFLRDLKQLEQDLHNDTKEAMQHAVEEAERHAKTTALFQDRTGVLRSQIVSWHTDTTGEVAANASYARWVESGTQPHLIVGNPFLRFEWRGEWVSFRAVNHPGTQPRPFMQRAGEWGEAVLFDGLSAFTQDAIRKFNSRG